MAHWERDLQLELASLIIFSETLVNDQIIVTTGHITATGRLLSVLTLTRADITKLKDWTALTATTTEAPLLAGPAALLHHSHQPDEELACYVVEADVSLARILSRLTWSYLTADWHCMSQQLSLALSVSRTETSWTV